MSVNSKLNFDIFARDHASPVFNKFGKQVGDTGKGMGVMAGGTKKLLGAFAGIAVASKAISFLKDANTEARESQKVNAQTAAALKSTGASAWQSSKGIGALADSISKKTAIDDEQIQSASNLLLTYKNVQNQTGKGSKIFDRATQSAVDLSAAGFGSVSGASKMLGKALNDPIKGISALGRAGVTFTDGQKAQIKAMVESGDVLGAQKMIMKEVESQVGGSAAAQATATDKLKVSWANFKELIGTQLIPVFDKLALAGVKVIAWLSNLKTNAAPVIAFFKGLSSGAGESGSKFSQFALTVQSVWANVKTIWADGVSIVTSLWARFGGAITSFASGAFTNMINIVRGAFNVIAGIFKIVSSLLKGDWRGTWEGIKQVVRGAWTVIKAVVSQGWNIIKTVFRIAGTALKALFVSAWNGIKAAAAAGIAKVVSAVRALPGKIKSALGNLGGLLVGSGKAVIQGLINGIQSRIGALRKKVSSLTSLIKSLKGPLSYDKVMLRPEGQAIMSGLIGAIASKQPALTRTLTGITRSIASTQIPQLGEAPAVGVRAAQPQQPAAGRRSSSTQLSSGGQPSAGLTKRDLIEILANASVKIQGGGNLKITLAGG